MKNELLTIGPFTVYGYPDLMMYAGIICRLSDRTSEPGNRALTVKYADLSNDPVVPAWRLFDKNPVLDHR